MASALRIGVVVFDGAEELDWAGPWEVLAAWSRLYPAEGTEVFTLSPAAGVVRCANGLRVLADQTWDSAPPIDVLVYPGGQGVRPQLGDDRVRAWVRRVAGTARLMTSVCTGSLVYADAGLLDGKRATTHWGSLDLLASLGDAIDVRPGERFVHAGSIVTAAGVSAGIDMALYVVGLLGSQDQANQVRRQIEYEAPARAEAPAGAQGT